MRISDWSSDVCSSDLAAGDRSAGGRPAGRGVAEIERGAGMAAVLDLPCPAVEARRQCAGGAPSRHGTVANRTRAVEMWRGIPRSEEHTSELQSLMSISYAVFCLTKKNKKRIVKKDNQ